MILLNMEILIFSKIRLTMMIIRIWKNPRLQERGDPWATCITSIRMPFWFTCYLSSIPHKILSRWYIVTQFLSSDFLKLDVDLFCKICFEVYILLLQLFRLKSTVNIQIIRDLLQCYSIIKNTFKDFCLTTFMAINTNIMNKIIKTFYIN